LRIVGQTAGIGGLALGVFLLLVRDIIRKNIFPKLAREHAYALLRLIVILVWMMSLAGLGTWYLQSQTAPSKVSRSQDTQARTDYSATLCRADNAPQLGGANPIDDGLQIRALIKAEGESAVAGDVNRYISLFRQDAVIEEAGGFQKGCKAIEARDVALFASVSFLRIEDKVVDLKIDGNSATATTSHEEEFLQDSVRSARSQPIEKVISRTKWAFIKDGFTWRIRNAVFGLDGHRVPSFASDPP